MSTGKVYVVTGSNKGIGYGIVEALALTLENAVIYLTARDASRGTEALNTLKLSHNNNFKNDLLFHQLDVEDPVSCQNFAHHLLEAHGGIDVLINNAGIGFQLDGPVNVVDQAKISVAINYYGTKRITQSLLPIMRPKGRVVNVCSQFGKMQDRYCQRLIDQIAEAKDDEDIDDFVEEYIQCTIDGTVVKHGFPESAYKVSKAAQMALTMLYSRTYKDQGIKFYACCPGYTNTDMTLGKGLFTIQEAADTPVYLATASDAPDGLFIYQRKPMEWY